MKRVSILLLAIIGLSILVPSSSARQSDTSRAVVAIDVNLDGLADLGFAQIQEGLQAGPLNGADLDVIKQVSRLTFYMSAPESMEAIAEPPAKGDPIPFELFVHIDFKNGEARQKLVDTMKEGIEEVTENGKKVFKPTDKGPSNLRMTFVGDKSLELGTENFMASTDKKFMTPTLLTTWNAAPKHALRLAVDLESAAELIDGALAAAGPNAPRPVKPFLDLVPKISTIRLTLDGKDPTLMSLAIDGKDEAAAGELFEAMEGLLGMAKMGATPGIEQMKEKLPLMATAATALVEALNSKKAGRTVSLTIPRPSNFSEAIKEAIDSGNVSESNQ